MMTYFTPIQRSILKYAWIPVILTIFIYFCYDYWMRRSFTSGYRTGPWIIALGYLPLIVAIGYDMLMRKNGLHFMLILLAALGMNGCMFWLNSRPVFLKPEVINGFWFNFLHMTLFFLVFYARAHLLKLKRPWLAGLLAMFVGWFMAPLGDSIYYIMRKLDFDFLGEEIISLPFRGMYPFMFLMGLALADNLVHVEGYFEKLRSKVQVIDGKEYMVLHFVTIWICFFSVIEMGWIAEALLRRLTSSEPDYIRSMYSPYVQLTTLIGILLCSIAAGYLLRNILISRMTTIGSSNGWLYVLHYMFLLNIIPVIIWGNAPQMHRTREENAEFYLFKEPSSVGIVTMWFGCISGLVLGISLAYHDAMLLAAFVTFAALMHPFLRQFREAIYCLIVINVITVAYLLVQSHYRADGIFIMTALMSIYLSAHMLMEIFHPRLSGKDAMPVQVLSV